MFRGELFTPRLLALDEDFLLPPLLEDDDLFDEDEDDDFFEELDPLLRLELLRFELELDFFEEDDEEEGRRS